jgi:hypothetical protein
MAKFRKKPVVIEAVQIPEKWDGESVPHALSDISMFIVSGRADWALADDGGVDITTLEGVMHGSPGDWIICGVSGELYPCKPDIFDATYEPA